MSFGVNIAATRSQLPAPRIAGVILLVVGYAALLPTAMVLGLAGAAAIWPGKAVR